MARVIWRDDALADLDRIADEVDQLDTEVVAQIVRRIIEGGDGLAAFPNRNRMAAAGQRQMMAVAPYILTYVVEDDIVSIVRIRHGARR